MTYLIFISQILAKKFSKNFALDDTALESYINAISKFIHIIGSLCLL